MCDIEKTKMATESYIYFIRNNCWTWRWCIHILRL